MPVPQRHCRPYVVDGASAFLTLQLSLKNIPAEMKGKFDDWALAAISVRTSVLEQIFKGHNEPLFNATPGLLSMSKKDWDEITRKLLKQYLKLSFKRTKFQGLNQKH
jgi:epoxyqueuosine reductase